MSHPRLLRLKIPAVVLAGLDLDRDFLDDVQAVTFDAANLLGVVRHDADVAQAEGAEDLAADAVVALVGGQTEAQVRVDGVEALLLKRVRVQLVRQTDAATFLAEVDEHAL